MRTGDRVFTFLFIALAISPSRTRELSAETANYSAYHLVPPGLAIGKAVDMDGLFLVPVIAAKDRPERYALDLLPLADGLAAGSVAIREYGVTADSEPAEAVNAQQNRQAEQAPRAQQAEAAQQVQELQQTTWGGDGARVNTLLISNGSGKHLLILAGDLIVGGKQNRVAVADMILPPGPIERELPVFCVEEERWRIDERVHKASFEAGPTGMAEQGLRKAIVNDGRQQKVWDEVESLNKSRASEQSDYTAAVMQKNVREAIEAAEAEALARLPVEGVCGLMAFEAGRCRGLDIFASPELFSAYRGRIIRAYLLDALAAAQAAARSPAGARAAASGPLAALDNAAESLASSAAPAPAGRSAPSETAASEAGRRSELEAQTVLEALGAARAGGLLRASPSGVFLLAELPRLRGGLLLFEETKAEGLAREKRFAHVALFSDD